MIRCPSASAGATLVSARPRQSLGGALTIGVETVKATSGPRTAFDRPFVALLGSARSMTSRGKRGVVRGVPAIISLAVLATALSLMAATANAAPTCGGDHASKARFLGTDGRDTITGTNGPDVIIGMDGFDTIRGRGGRDEHLRSRRRPGRALRQQADRGRGGRRPHRRRRRRPDRGRGEADTLRSIQFVGGTGGNGTVPLASETARNTLDGGPGHDLIAAGTANDVLRGGGADR